MGKCIVAKRKTRARKRLGFGRYITPEYLTAYAALLTSLRWYVFLLVLLVAGCSVSTKEWMPIVDWKPIAADLGTIA